MSTTTRRSARGQALPTSETEILLALHGFDLYARCAQLYSAGWTLRAIGEAFIPPKSRSTMRSWVDRGTGTAPHTLLPSVQPPELVTPPAYVPVKPVSPGINPLDRARIIDLAPVARRYRSGMGSQHPSTSANSALTNLCKRLYDDDVTISELADAAGVTYRAMAKRLGRT